MKQMKLLLSLAFVVTVSVIMAGIIGCEKDGDTGSDLDAYFKANPYISDPRDSTDDAIGGKSLTITPTSAPVTLPGQKVVFTVSNGIGPYTWAVASGGAGSIAKQTGNDGQAIYTVTTVSDNNVIVSDANGKAAIANITVTVNSLAISPGPGLAIVDPSVLPIVATYPASATFTAIGGNPPYAWTLVYNAGVATLSATTGSSVDYLALGNTNIINTITVTDSKGASAQSNITHKH
jgi:hypothetical protein